MNISIIVNSLKYLDEFSLICSLSIWIYEELKLINYSDAKLIKSFERRNFKVTENIILLVKDKELLSEFTDRDYIKNSKLIITKLFLSIDCYKEELLTSISYNGNNEVVKLLLENGADIHAENDYALQLASENNNTEVVKLLLENGADVHAYDDYTLRYASKNGYTEIVKLLLENGADVHAENDYALRHASKNGYTEIVKLLSSINK